MASGELRPDDSELIILSVLGDAPLYGYAITKSVAARSSGELRLTPGVLYPLLAKLEKQGFINSTWETIHSDRNEVAEEEGATGAGASGGGRKRKWYRISAKGRKRLEQRVQAHKSYLSLIASFISPASEAKERAQ
jgi:PadR family transcriptional regulator PadR